MARRPSKPRRRRPGNPRSGEPARLTAAKSLFQKQRYEESLKAFGQAIREHRDNIQVLVDAGRAYAARFQPEKALALFERAAKLGHRTPDVQFIVGESYRMMLEFSAAERSFRRAFALTDTAPRAALELANLCERGHRLEEALEWLDRVHAHWPDSASAAIVKARVLRRQGNGPTAVQLLQELLAGTAAKPTLCAEAWGELAETFDALGEYAQAWKAIETCKEFLRPAEAAPWAAAQHVTQRFTQFFEDLREEDLRSWSLPAADHSPTRVLLLTGFPRSGTTLLEQMLDAHPEIVSAEEHDLLSSEVFPRLGHRGPHEPVVDVLNALEHTQRRASREDYLCKSASIVRTALGDRWLLDKNPAMTPMIPVFHRLFPEGRVVVALRDPRDVVLSCYLRYLPLNPVSVHFLDLRRSARKFAHDLQCWLRYRQLAAATPLAETCLEVRYEAVIDDHQRESRRVLDHLSLPWDDRVGTYRERLTQKWVTSPTYAQVSQPITTRASGRWSNYQSQLAPALEILEPVVEALQYS